MTSSIHIYNHFRELETTIENVPTTPRSWVLSGYGRCEFSVSLDDPNCTERYLQFGNLIRVEHIPTVSHDEDPDGPTGKLPDWVGIIMPPRTWDDGAVHVVAYSAEAILAYRAMPYVTVEGLPPDVFQQIIGYVREKDPNLVWDIGVADLSTLTFSDDLRTNAYDHINKLAKFGGYYWNVYGRVEPSSYALSFVVDLKMKNNEDIVIRSLIDPRSVSGKVFSLTTDNTELQNPLLTEQGTPTNQIFAYTHSYTAADRVMQEVIHQGSYNDYGPFQLNAVYLGQHDATSVADATAARQIERGRPSKLFKRVALDVRETFGALRVGALAYVDEPRVGFNPAGGFGFKALVRIISMDYNDTTNKVSMNVEAV